jgi:putative NIF3 family GTP cyclohydrolase 1 type 2
MAGEPLQDTVDTVKSGDPTQPCTGIASTFLATAEVIKAAAERNVNLIITHEPTYYNHLDETDWLEDDPVYEFKRKLLEDNGIVVWRFHDYWHRHQPDGILHGFLKAVGWRPYLQEDRQNTCLIPETSLKELAAFFKGQLKLDRCFYVGDPALRFRNVALLPGAWGRLRQIETLRREDVEVVVVGEVLEWETCEWVRDAHTAGMKKGLIVLGHAMSEEPGMEYLTEWLRPKVPDVAVYHIPATDPFKPV